MDSSIDDLLSKILESDCPEFDFNNTWTDDIDELLHDSEGLMCSETIPSEDTMDTQIGNETIVLKRSLFKTNLTILNREILHHVYKMSNGTNVGKQFSAHMEILNHIYCGNTILHLKDYDLLNYVKEKIAESKLTRPYAHMLSSSKDIVYVDDIIMTRYKDCLGTLLTILFFSKLNPLLQE